ncbi:MAG: hypothetical protein JWR81_821 [Pseudonocardia sp.]|jgi:hypothetical protein|nr:hypothetical protein [Pseudonocardia sp.]MDT7615826.1 hypothetical protein [Pseudonocardiales bacterium]
MCTPENIASTRSGGRARLAPSAASAYRPDAVSGVVVQDEIGPATVDPVRVNAETGAGQVTETVGPERSCVGEGESVVAESLLSLHSSEGIWLAVAGAARWGRR